MALTTPGYDPETFGLSATVQTTEANCMNKICKCNPWLHTVTSSLGYCYGNTDGYCPRRFIMRPSSLGGGRILRRTLSVRQSVRPSRYRYRASRRAT